jgi:hypothetical protein
MQDLKVFPDFARMTSMNKADRTLGMTSARHPVKLLCQAAGAAVLASEVLALGGLVIWVGQGASAVADGMVRAGLAVAVSSNRMDMWRTIGLDSA